jgi:DNA-binding transcriptional regulator YiaG
VSRCYLYRGRRSGNRAVPLMTGDEVKRIRARQKMSQSEFARALAVPVRTLQQWEQGKRSPRSAAVALLKLMGRCRAKK